MNAPQLLASHWWIADDYVKLHVFSKQLGDPSLDVVGMDECVGMCFLPLAAIHHLLACTAVRAFAVYPGVRQRPEPDIAAVGRESLGNRVFAIGML